MSAAVERRRKQIAKKKTLFISTDPITSRLNELLSSEKRIDESTAYEALQLAQSQVRRHVKMGKYELATITFAYDTSMKLLKQHSRVSVASQLLSLLVHVLKETHTICDLVWIKRLTDLNFVYVSTLHGISQSEIKMQERARLMRVQLKFLLSSLSWSDLLGTVNYGAYGIHELVGIHYWRLSEIERDMTNQSKSKKLADEEKNDLKIIGLQCEAVTHLALAEKPSIIYKFIKDLPKPRKMEMCAGHTCPPALRDELLTRSILMFLSIENVRDANILLRKCLFDIDATTIENMKKSYLSKVDKKAPSHLVFNSMLISLCLKDKKTGPLYTWLLRSFSVSELSHMYKPDILNAYTTRIGQSFFNIQPPPDMLSTLENMMTMMSGAASVGGMNIDAI